MNKESQDLLQALLSGDNDGIREIYRLYLPRASNLITRNGGNADDAKDIFQEALIILYEKARKPGFQLKSSLYTLIYGICRNLWGNRLQKKSSSNVTFSEDDKYKFDEDIEKSIEEAEENRIFWDAFDQLGDDCRKLMRLFFDKVRMEKIAELMGFGSVSYAKKRKFQCKERLVSLVRADLRFKDLKL
ncbi:MAG: sigma-70 family RNA polymerase sigma factor [Phaeodactylibacter sp.]|nr:sigma-70 family RNA polymerase sigma factor [Phaeodactylibacter sp.]